MTEQLFRVGIIQDSSDYFERAATFLEGVAQIVPATDLNAGLTMIRELASGKLQLELLALDENLTEGDYDGGDGQQLYELFRELGLEGKIPVVSISSDSKLPIQRITSAAGRLLEEVRSRSSHH